MTVHYPWAKIELWTSAVLLTHALSSSIYSFMLKNQLQNRSNCEKLRFHVQK